MQEALLHADLVRLALHGADADPVHPPDLAEADAAGEQFEHRLVEARPAVAVVLAEGLRREGDPAGAAAETLHGIGVAGGDERAVAQEEAPLRARVLAALGVGAEGWDETQRGSLRCSAHMAAAEA